MTGNDWKWLELAGNGWKWQKWLEMAGNGFKRMKTMMMMLEKQIRWPYHSFDCVLFKL